MIEINLLNEYPMIKRDTEARYKEMTKERKDIAKKYGWEFFDKKGICYDGYSYDGRWIPIAKRFIEYYNLKPGDKVLDVGCAKGYFVYDLVNLGIDTYGLDISKYAIGSSPDEIKDRLCVGNASDLSMFGDKEFDLVISINTVHNLDEPDCRKSIREIQRIGKNAFITVDSYRNAEEKIKIDEWNITALTIKSIEGWKKIFDEECYTGDYYWFIP